MTFLYTNSKLPKREIKKIISLIVATKSKILQDKLNQRGERLVEWKF